MAAAGQVQAGPCVLAAEAMHERSDRSPIASSQAAARIEPADRVEPKHSTTNARFANLGRFDVFKAYHPRSSPVFA
jgi:hypothetical protein